MDFPFSYSKNKDYSRVTIEILLAKRATVLDI